MVSDELLEKIQKERDKYGGIYLDKVNDFIKWTTTFGIAGLLWIGGSFSANSGFSKYLAIFSLLALILSIFFAITIFYASIRYWSILWNTYQMAKDIISRDWKTILSKSLNKPGMEDKIAKAQEILKGNEISDDFMIDMLKDLDRINQKEGFTETYAWDYLIKVHLYSLFIGFVLYILAIFTPLFQQFLNGFDGIKVSMHLLSLGSDVYWGVLVGFLVGFITNLWVALYFKRLNNELKGRQAGAFTVLSIACIIIVMLLIVGAFFL